MIAVIGRTELLTGDAAYPIGYFSDQEISPLHLHQPWCRTMYWFKDEDGNPVWSVANDEFDFDLLPHVERGKLKWVELDHPDSGVFPKDGEVFPWSGLEGDRERQQLVAGERELLGLPTGEVLNPFEEGEEGEGEEEPLP
jgi:hypothetical protein